MEKLNVLQIILHLLGGVVLFLYGIGKMSDATNHLAGERLKIILKRFTYNLFLGILSGFLVTAILSSSSAVIILVIVLVNAQLLSFRQAIGVILGANIGTTVSSQIIAFKVAEYASILLLIGFLGELLFKNERSKNIASIVLGFGMLFFGLDTMDTAVYPLRNYPLFIEWMTGLVNPIWGCLVGGLLTLIIQSSSATVGIVITLAGQGLISLPAGIAVMLGAEIGTCSDTLIASIGRSKSSIKVGLFHLCFNIIAVIIGILVIQPFTQFVIWFSGETPLARKIANAHFLFNLGSVLMLVVLLKIYDLFFSIPKNRQSTDPKPEKSVPTS